MLSWVVALSGFVSKDYGFDNSPTIGGEKSRWCALAAKFPDQQFARDSERDPEREALGAMGVAWCAARMSCLYVGAYPA